MAPTKHSDFSASASSRLLACPGSFLAGKLASAQTGRRSTIFSAEGTLAHALAESALSSNTDPHGQIGNTLSADGFSFVVDQDMADYIAVYVNLLRGLRAMGYKILLEQQVTPQWLWARDGLPDLNIHLFGTADCIAYNPDTERLMIVDLKYGRGVPVEVTDNPQLMYYASGAMDPVIIRELCRAYGLTNAAKIGDVELVICQPRAPHPDGPIRSAVYTALEITNWNINVLYPGVEKAINDNGQTLASGKHCRFCPAANGCPEQERFALETAKMAFRAAPIENIPADDPAQAILPEFDLANDKLGQLLDRIEIVGPWMEGLRSLAADRLNAGQDVPGWKTVPKRASRKWADDDDVVIAQLKGEGFREDQITTRKLLSPTQVEKSVGKSGYATHVQQFVSRQSSGTALAPEGDPRARLQGRTAREAFNLAAPTETKE